MGPKTLFSLFRPLYYRSVIDPFKEPYSNYSGRYIKETRCGQGGVNSSSLEVLAALALSEEARRGFRV